MDKRLTLLVLAVVVVIGGTALYLFLPPTPTDTDGLTVVRIAGTPHQDTTLYMWGMEKGIFEELGLSLDIRDTTFAEQIELVAGGGCDIAMSTVDEIAIRSKNLNAVGKRVLYILPAWLFEGHMFACRPELDTLAELRGRYDEAEARKQFLAQLKGMKLAVPESSSYDQALRAFIKGAGESVDDFTFVNTQLEVGINGLGDSDVGIAAAGIVERPEAMRRGYEIALDSVDLGMIVITGFICRADYYEQNADTVHKFIDGWFRSVEGALDNHPQNYEIFSSYLSGRGAKPPTLEDFKIALDYTKLAKTPEQAGQMFLEEGSLTYWEKPWDEAVQNLIDTGKADQVPESKEDFVGGQIIDILSDESRD